MVFKLFLFFMYFTQIINGQDLVTLVRSKRYVPPIVFPPTAPTRVQLIFGIGIPEGDLAYESLTNGWVFKYEYFLPSNATQLYVPATLNIKGRSVLDKRPNLEQYEAQAELIKTEINSNDIEQSDVSVEDYDYIKTNIDELSEVREKEKKMLSQYRWAIYSAIAAAADRNGLVGRSCVLKGICETAATKFHYQNGILSELLHIILTPSASKDQLSTHSDNEYFQAEILGQSGAPCDIIFKDCKKSLIDIFTDVLDVDDDLLSILM